MWKFDRTVTELRMLLAEWLILLAARIMTPQSDQTAIWCRHLRAAGEEISASFDRDKVEKARR